MSTMTCRSTSGRDWNSLKTDSTKHYPHDMPIFVSRTRCGAQYPFAEPGPTRTATAAAS